MDLYVYILLVIITVSIVLIWYINTYNQYQNYIIRINEAEATIDSILRKRFDLLNKSIGVIKGNVNIEGDILELIVKLRSRKLTNFELDRQLYEAINEFQKLREEFPKLKNSESFVKIEIGLSESESEIIASRKYYNDIITDYNKLVHRFPSNIIAGILKYPHKTYFDGKDMTDSVINDFKL